MAIYHCSVKAISRAAGRSATAAAAYRSGSKIEDQRTAEIHDYTRKGGVMVTGIVVPEDAPAWANDRAALWNQAEASEKRKNSTVAREVEVALPSELNAGQMRKLTEDYGKWLSARYGVAVDWAVHQAHRHGDDRNHHAHMLMTTRTLGPEGLGAKTRVLDDKLTGPDEVKAMREHWAGLVNRSLELADKEVRVDHRSLRAQEVDRVPQIHAGPAAIGIERKEATRKAGPALRGAVDAALVGQTTKNGGKLVEIWAANRAAAVRLWEEQNPARWYHRLLIIKGNRDKSREVFVQVKMTKIAPAGHAEAQAEMAQAQRERQATAQRERLFGDVESLAYQHHSGGLPQDELAQRAADVKQRRDALSIPEDDPRMLAAYERGRDRADTEAQEEAHKQAQEALREAQRALEAKRQEKARKEALEAQEQAREAQRQAKAKEDASRAAIARLVAIVDDLPTNERYHPAGEFMAIHPANNGRAVLILRDRVGENIPFSVPERLLKLAPPKIGTVVMVLTPDHYRPNGEYCTDTLLLKSRADDLRAAIKEHDDREARRHAKWVAEKQRKRGTKKDLGQGKGK